jgi:GT2 family glycosyltransferase
VSSSFSAGPTKDQEGKVVEEPILHAIAINYFGSAHVENLVESFRGQNHDGWRLTIVDNSRSATELALLKDVGSTDSRVDVLACPENLGYFGGAHWVTQNPGSTVCRWTAVCNVDLVLADEDFVGLLATRKDNPEVVAPSIRIAATGRDQNPYMLLRPSKRSMRFRRFVFRHRTISTFAKFWANRSTKQGAPQGHSRSPIYAAHGAFIIFNRRFFARGGSLEHEPFLFAEEITIAEMCQRNGMVVVYDPLLRVTHDEHQATGMNGTNATWAVQKAASSYAYDLIARRSPSSKASQR